MKRQHIFLAISAAALALAAGIVIPASGTTGVPVLGCVGTVGGVPRVLSHVYANPANFKGCPAGTFEIALQGADIPSPSPSATSSSPSPSPSPTTTSPSPSPSPSATGAACVVPLGGNCGAYSYAQIPMSNGFDTYVANQNVGANSGTTETVTATDPGSWTMVSDALPLGYLGVQTFPDVQQLTNDWCGTGWGGCASPTDTPLNSLSALKVSYIESAPTGPSDIYEFAPDVWSENYPSDVMFWADTHGRCDQGAFGGTILGNVTISGQAWTVHRYGDFGAEIIFVLDGAGGTGTCAQQPAGTIDIKAGFDWLTSNGFVTGPEVLTQVNTGWEVTSADNAAFAMSAYSITAVPG